MIIFTKTNVESTETVEGENLAAHVIICRERDSAVNNRLNEIDERLDKIETKEYELRTSIFRTITTAAFALLSSAVSLGVLFSEFVKK